LPTRYTVNNNTRIGKYSIWNRIKFKVTGFLANVIAGEKNRANKLHGGKVETKA